jgi:hypothetical protein
MCPKTLTSISSFWRETIEIEETSEHERMMSVQQAAISTDTVRPLKARFSLSRLEMASSVRDSRSLKGLVKGGCVAESGSPAMRMLRKREFTDGTCEATVRVVVLGGVVMSIQDTFWDCLIRLFCFGLFASVVLDIPLFFPSLLADGFDFDRMAATRSIRLLDVLFHNSPLFTRISALLRKTLRLS